MPNPSLATQRSINDITTSSIKTNKSQGHQSDTTSGKRGVAPVEKAVPGDKSGAPASGGGNGNGSSKKPATKLSSPKGITFSSIVAASFKVHWTSVENSVDYQIRVYRANGQAIVFEDNVGGMATVFTVNSGVDLSENTYRVSVQALAGDNSDYADSPESGKFVVAIRVCGNDGLIVGTTNICQVGDNGPGGGVIFYYSAVGFNCGAFFSATGSPSEGLCHYLEVAPANWSKPNCDSTVVWNGRSGVDSNEINVCDPNLHWADANHQWIPEVAAIAIDPVFAEYNVLANIGGGYLNSVKIVEFNANCTNPPTPSDPRPCITAAGAARAFQGGALIDWYLPNMAELNLLCKFAVGDLTGPVTSCTGGGQFPRPAGLNQKIYWSSSAAADAYGAHQAWQSWFEDGAYRKGFIGNWVAEFVRPIRSF